MDNEFLVEGFTPDIAKRAIQDIKSKNIQSFLKKYENKVKNVSLKQLEKDIEEIAKNVGIKEENVTTAKVMLKRTLGTIFIGVSATILLPITLACLIACIIRAIKTKKPIIRTVLGILKEIKNGIKTTRRTNITNVEKAIITAGQAADYLWGVLSNDPIVSIKNLLAFIGMFIAAIYFFFKGIVFAGERIKS